MRLGITGARGFIGSNLVSHLDSVCVPYVVMEREKFESYLNSGITHIVHLAGRTSSSKNLLLSDYLRDNVVLASKLLDLAHKIGAPVLLFSTYGYHPIQDIPPSAYHLSKALLEDVASYYASKFGLSIQILRLGSVYGANQSHGSLLFNILDQVNNSKKSLALHNVSALRSYVSVLDVIDFIMASLEKTAGYQTHFVGSPDLYSVKDFASLVLKIIGCTKSLEFALDDTMSEMELGLNMAIRHNMSMGNQYGWVPKRSLYQGLLEILQ